MDHHYVKTNGIRLHVAQDGPQDGPLLILLHGFPEFSYGWRHQIPYLASLGYRVWAPDQRGYNLSDKPAGIASYALDALAADVVGLIDAAGQERAFLVGHDWGGGVAWWVAAKYADRLAKMVIMNAPHVAVLQDRMRHDFAQLRKSWYILFFQLPWIAEKLSQRRDWQFLTRMLEHSSRQGTFSDSDLDQYRKAWSQPRAYHSMLHWYRAMVQRPSTPPPSPRIAVPTLLIWGAQDTAFEREVAQQSIDLCDEGRLVMLEEATHWVQHDEADRVNELIHGFLRDGS